MAVHQQCLAVSHEPRNSDRAPAHVRNRPIRPINALAVADASRCRTVRSELQLGVDAPSSGGTQLAVFEDDVDSEDAVAPVGRAVGPHQAALWHGDSMEIRFVGSGDAFGSGGRFQTCIHLQAEGLTVLVDCGATSLTALKAQRLDPNEVDAVVVSHLHGDHFGGLPFLVIDGQFSRRIKPLTVYGPAGISTRLAAAMETLYPGSATVQRRFAVRVVELDGYAEDGPLTVSSWEVDHPSGAPALAVRVQLGDRAFAYSGDTAWTPALLSAAKDADVFACEAYTYNHPVRYHLDYATVVERSGEFATKHLILTHMGPTVLARLAELEIPCAFDGLVLTT